MTKKYVDMFEGEYSTICKFLYQNKRTSFDKIFEFIYFTPCKEENEFVARLLLQHGLETSGLSKFTEIMRGINGSD